MGSLEFVGGGASFYFAGLGSSPGMANGRTERGRGLPPDGGLLSTAKSGEVEVSGHVGEGSWL